MKPHPLSDDERTAIEALMRCRGMKGAALALDVDVSTIDKARAPAARVRVASAARIRTALLEILRSDPESFYWVPGEFAAARRLQEASAA